MAEEQKSLAFTFQKKKVVQKVAVNIEERKDNGQLISGFDGAKAQVVGGGAEAEGKTYVIQKLENTFKTGVGPKKFTPTFKPPSNDVVKVKEGEDKFVQAASTVPVITEYGLHLREAKPEDRGEGAAAATAAAAPNGAGLSTAVLEERAFREAMEELPDVADVEAYEAMPVEEFGRAMLRGMGWQEGMGVGRNRKVVEAIEYVRRPDRLGLGAQPVKLAEDTSKPVKMGDKPRKQDLVLPPDASGRQRNIRTLDEQLVSRSTVLPGPQPGKAMRITGGPHAGLACTALEALPKAEGRPERWRVRLSASGEEAEVLARELGEKWEREPARREDAAAAAGAANGSRGREAGGEGGAGRGRERGGSREPERERERRGTGDDEEPGGRPSGSGRGSGEEAGEPRRGEAGRRDDFDGRGGSRGRDRDGERERDRDAERRRDRDRERERDDDGGGGKRKHRDRDDEEERHGKKHHKREKHEKRDKHSKRDKQEKRDKKREKQSREQSGSSDSEDGGPGGSGREEERPRGPTWLFPNIQVRVVDKRVRGGKLYLKKGRVVDVHPGGSADVFVDDTGDLLRLSETSLETVVPKHEGAAVLIVAGPQRGARGRLLQASVSAGAAAVQLAADFSIVRLLLDDVAGFVGEMEEE